MKKKSKILYVCQEISPYMPESDMSLLCRTLVQSMQERGCEIRTFMPKYGNINERRNQLHEVIRLSGMNLIIDDNDHQLIIKVASIPSARVQVYFIDNEDYFGRKAALVDEDQALFEDNDERAIFFARGVLETVKKLRWTPTIIHCHGWFSSIVPIYLKHVFANDPIFKKMKIVVSLYDDAFPGELSKNFAKKISNEGVNIDELKILDEPTYENLMKLIVSYADGVIVEGENIGEGLEKAIKESGVPVLKGEDKTTTAYLDSYQKFYEELH